MRTLLAAFFLFSCLLMADDRVNGPTPAGQPPTEDEIRALLDSINPVKWKFKPEQWKLKLSLGRQPFVLQQEMILGIELTNTSDTQATLLDDQGFDYDIVLEDAAGRRIRPTSEGMQFLYKLKPKTHFIVIERQPHQSDSKKVDLAKLFDLTKPGKYKVTMARYENITRSPPAHGTSLDFTVK